LDNKIGRNRKGQSRPLGTEAEVKQQEREKKKKEGGPWVQPLIFSLAGH
jgi:hypothetical protein